MSRTLAALLTACLLPASALGAEPSGPSGELAGMLMPRKTWSAFVDALSREIQAGLESPHAGAKVQFPPDFSASVRKEVEGALPYERLLGIQAKELSTSFTEPELEDLLAFYRTPTGQKALGTLPGMQQRVATRTQQHMTAKAPEIMDRLTKLAKMPEGAKGAKHPAPAAPPAKPAPAAPPAKPAPAASPPAR
jgi:hypothetical protein